MFFQSCLRCGWPGWTYCHACFKHILWTYPGLPDLQTPHLSAIHAATFFCDEAENLVKVIKYEKCFAYCKTMAQLSVLTQSEWFHEQKIDVLVPVPLHKKRLRWRGFNQAHRFALELSRLLNIPVAPLLQKTLQSKSQATLNKDERDHSQNLFSVRRPVDLEGLTICLIDDVVTTGNTLEKCAQVLHACQPNRVVAFTFSRTE